MASPFTAKPATARDTRAPASKVERFAGGLDNHNIPSLTDIQARRLTRRFALSMSVAIVVASLHYGEATS
jgi:hypothetical protein